MHGEDKVRRWGEGVLCQAREEIGTNTRAVLWNAGAVSEATCTATDVAVEERRRR